MADAVAWLWVIEYIASCKQIDPSILHDLINEAPQLPEDLGRNTREMVALKCLEHLFPSNNSRVSSTRKITLDVNQSCEHVLHSILKETSVNDLKRAGPDLLKWDVQPFIWHKRASMPKCALQQLKDAILEGSHVCSASLREFGGLLHKNKENDGVTVGCGSGSNGTDNLVVASERINNQHLFENENVLGRGVSQPKNLLPVKRNGDNWVNDHPAGDYQDQGGTSASDYHLNAKKRKTNASCAAKYGEENLVAQSCKGVEEDSHELMIGISKRNTLENSHENSASIEICRRPTDGGNDGLEHRKCGGVNNVHKMPEGSLGDGAHQCDLVEEVNTAEPRGPDGKQSMRSPTKVVAEENIDKGDSCDPRKQPNVVSTSQFPEDAAVEKLERHKDNPYEEDSSSESSGHHHEKIDVSMEKNLFLSSQCTTSHVCPSDWKINLCVRCGKDGQLLACNAVGCPLVVHERCLGCPPNFDDDGNFYCPFCAYSYAISKYLQAQKKAALARKELAAFIRTRPDEWDNKKHSNLERVSNKEHFDKTHESEDLEEGESHQINDKEHAHSINDQLKKASIEKQLKKPMFSHMNRKAINREEGPEVTHETTHISPVESENEKMASECPPARTVDRQDKAPAGHKCHDDISTSENKEILSSNEKEHGGGMQKKTLDKQPFPAGNVDEVETSDDESDENVIHNYSIRLRRRGVRERQYVSPAMPQVRRKKVSWTTEEEKILEEGVRKFLKIGDKTIPWKKILEYGRSVFLNNRNTIDLKDKWRNICKGSPKCK